jgi:penicillin amidase
MALNASFLLGTTGGTIFTIAYFIYFVGTFIYITSSLATIVALCNGLAMYLAIIFVTSFFSLFLWTYRLITSTRKEVNKQKPKYHILGLDAIENSIAKKASTERQLSYLTYLSIVLCIIIVILQFTFCVFISVIKSKSAPIYNGQFPSGLKTKLRKPDQPPIIQRDTNQVIHITAQNELDLYYAQGVAMAQERLFQMDFQRRVGKGQVSEIVGSAGLNIDKLMRSLNIYTTVRNDANTLTGDTAIKLQAFVDGINAYINNDPPLTIEFWLLGYSPRPFQIEDVLVTIKVLAWTLDGNLNSELTRYIMTLNGISIDRILNVLMPPYPATGPTIINAQNMPLSQTRRLFSTNEQEKDATIGAYVADDATINAGPYKLRDNSDMDVFLPGISHTARSVQASNNWVLGGQITDSGLPLLACDTHLTLSALGHFLLMHLRVDPTGTYSTIKPQYEIDAIGASIVGAPTIVLGRNGYGVAWGMTNVGADVKDFFVLTESSQNTSYMVNGQPVKYNLRTEVIKVKDDQDVVYIVKDTKYGPVMNDAMGLPGNNPLALKWMGTTYQGDTTIETFLSLLRVSNWNQFKQAFSTYVGPAQNFIYADAQNNIGYLLPGKFPIRTGGYSGLFPVSGNGTYDWAASQYPSFNSLPSLYITSAAQQSVSQPYIFSANNKAYPDGMYSSYTIASDWLVDDYRAVRIGQMINDKTAGGRKVLFSDIDEMQLDVISNVFQRHKNILDHIGPITDGKYASDAENFRLRLLEWNGQSAGNKETTVFEEWVFNLATLAGKEVNSTFMKPNPGYTPSTVDLQRFYSLRYIFNVIDAEIRGTNTSIEKNCIPYGSCVQFAKQMFSLSITDLKDRFGNVPTWGELIHWSVFNHPVFSNVASLQCMTCRRVYTIGGTQTVNVAPPNLGMFRFASNFGPAYRQLIDLKYPENSLFIAPMGQNGNFLSQFYDNYLSMWKKGQYVPMKMRDYVVTNTVTF